MTVARALPLLALALGALAVPRAGAGDAPPSPFAWGLGLSDAAVYERRPVTTKDGNGQETLEKASFFAVFGHDLRDFGPGGVPGAVGQYVPVTPDRSDLPAILAMRLPPADGSPVEFALPLRDAVVLRVKGTYRIEIAAGAGPEATVSASYAFASHGAASKDQPREVRDGTARVRLAFDRDRRVVMSSRAVVLHVTRDADAPRGTKPAGTSTTLDFRLKDVKRARYEGFQKDVDAAIDRGVGYVRTLRKPDGTFPPVGNWAAGTTALCLLTLAECDVPRDDPVMQSGFQWLCTTTPDRNYERAVALMALERAYTPPGEEALLKSGAITTRRRNLTADQRAWAERTAERLETGVESPGSWGYPPGTRALLRFDSSNTQMAAMGLRAASRMGIAVKETTWIGLVRHFELLREKKGPRGSVLLEPEGRRAPAPGETATPPVPTTVDEVAGFGYSTFEPGPWASMTAAGIACLTLARHELLAVSSRRMLPPRVEEIEKEIRGAWAWLDRHWGVDRNAEHPRRDWLYYALYSLERAGILGGVRLVGGKDWYFEGAVELLGLQAADGSWDEGGGDHTAETCLALLFLKRATAPLTDGR